MVPGVPIDSETVAHRNFCGRDIRASIRQLLSAFPLDQPIALDGDEYEVEVRRMAIGRYRVLFTVTETTVTVLRIRGPHRGQN